MASRVDPPHRRPVSLDHPLAVAALLGALRGAGADNSAVALAARAANAAMLGPDYGSQAGAIVGLHEAAVSMLAYSIFPRLSVIRIQRTMPNDDGDLVRMEVFLSPEPDQRVERTITQPDR